MKVNPIAAVSSPALFANGESGREDSNLHGPELYSLVALVKTATLDYDFAVFPFPSFRTQCRKINGLLPFAASYCDALHRLIVGPCHKSLASTGVWRPEPLRPGPASAHSPDHRCTG